MRAAGLVVARTLERVAGGGRARASPPASSTRIAEESIRGEGAVPSFLGYHGFPALDLRLGRRRGRARHPAATGSLREGELLSIDCGAILDGWHGDAAVTVPVGECAPELLALSARHRAGAVGRARRGAPRRPAVRRRRTRSRQVVRPHGYGLLEDYTGHGIGTAMHEPPYVPNLAPAGPRPRHGARAGHRAGGRADGHARQRPRSRSSTTAGPWSRPTAARPPTGSTPWPSRRTGRGCSPRSTAAPPAGQPPRREPS